MTWSRFTASFCHTLSPSQGPDDSLARFGFAAGHGIDPEATTTCLCAMASTWAVATIGIGAPKFGLYSGVFEGPKSLAAQRHTGIHGRRTARRNVAGHECSAAKQHAGADQRHRISRSDAVQQAGHPTGRDQGGHDAEN